jgi:hypothetical protein
MKHAPERAGKSGSASAPRWAVFHRQFDLVRAEDGLTYLTRWWLVKTPWGGIALHKMMAGDARTTIHDHPFNFLSIVLRGGYIERRRRPHTLSIRERHVVRHVNRVHTYDAHSIIELLRVPTWTLLLVGRHQRTWGFWQPATELFPGTTATYWQWTEASDFNTGHYVPLPGEKAMP